MTMVAFGLDLKAIKRPSSIKGDANKFVINPILERSQLGLTSLGEVAIM